MKTFNCVHRLRTPIVVTYCHKHIFSPMLDRIVIPIEAPYVDDETSVFNLTRVQAMQDIQQS